MLGSLLRMYAFGLVAFAVTQTLFAKRQPPNWVTLGELGLAMVFLGVALFIAQRAYGNTPTGPD